MSVLEIIDAPFLLLLLLVIAFLYSGVGHGGASGYLALMSFFSFPISFMKPTALVLNLVVAAISFYFYYREKQFKKELFIPFAITSVPFSFLGGFLKIDGYYYKIILATTLIFAVLRLLGIFGKQKTEIKEINLPLALIIGAVIGFLSGLIGIGGGIILSPVILLFGWANIKQTAAVSAIFIWVNSFSGLLGFLSNGGSLSASSTILIGGALVGGALGGYYGSARFNTTVLRHILALVLGIAIFKLYTTA